LLFFFSSRRRHTRSKRDWSSDVCSSDLGKVDVLVSGIGTGGTLTGAGRYLKKQNPDIKIVAVEPADSPILSGGKPGPHKIQGIGANFVPEVLDTVLYSSVYEATLEESVQNSRLLGAKEGI